jgi:hypothetical protein
MYEYISDLERWKKFDQNYNKKYSSITNFVRSCELNCKKNKKIEEDLNSCLNLCKKPIIDIERFNYDINKRTFSDVYELCSNKSNDISDLNKKINKVKSCFESLYRENEMIVKKEMENRIDDMINFLKIQ